MGIIDNMDKGTNLAGFFLYGAISILILVAGGAIAAGIIPYDPAAVAGATIASLGFIYLIEARRFWGNFKKG